MENDGLVVRTVYAEVPPKVEYELSELGKTLRPVLDALSNWGEEYKKRFEFYMPGKVKNENAEKLRII